MWVAGRARTSGAVAGVCSAGAHSASTCNSLTQVQWQLLAALKGCLMCREQEIPKSQVLLTQSEWPGVKLCCAPPAEQLPPLSVVSGWVAGLAGNAGVCERKSFCRQSTAFDDQQSFTQSGARACSPTVGLCCVSCSASRQRQGNVKVLGLSRPLFVLLLAAGALYCWYRSRAWLGLALALLAGVGREGHGTAGAALAAGIGAAAAASSSSVCGALPGGSVHVVWRRRCPLGLAAQLLARCLTVWFYLT